MFRELAKPTKRILIREENRRKTKKKATKKKTRRKTEQASKNGRRRELERMNASNDEASAQVAS